MTGMNALATTTENHSSLRHNVASPAANTLNIARVSVGSGDHSKSPYGPGAESAAKRHHSELERLFHL